MAVERYAPATLPALEERIRLVERELIEAPFNSKHTKKSEEALRLYLTSLYLARPGRVFGFRLTGLTTTKNNKEVAVPDLTIWRRGRTQAEAEIKAADAIRCLDLVPAGECVDCEGIGRVIHEAGPRACPVCHDADGTV